MSYATVQYLNNSTHWNYRRGRTTQCWFLGRTRYFSELDNDDDDDDYDSTYGSTRRTNFFLSARCDAKVSDHINYVGRTIANNSGNYTVKGKIEFFWSLFKNIANIAQMSTIGALHYFSHGLGIIADAAQWALEYLGYKKIGKAVGLIGNVAAGALVGGLSGGPVGAVVGGVGGLVRWGIRELPNLIGWLFNW